MVHRESCHARDHVQQVGSGALLREHPQGCRRGRPIEDAGRSPLQVQWDVLQAPVCQAAESRARI